jgi:hypothetical protein
MKKIDPPKLSSRGEPPKNHITPIPSDFVDLLDLEDPVHLRNPTNVTPQPENMTLIKIEEKKEESPLKNKEEVKNNNPFDFDFTFLSKKEEPNKKLDQIDILFG